MSRLSVTMVFALVVLIALFGAVNAVPDGYTAQCSLTTASGETINLNCAEPISFDCTQYACATFNAVCISSNRVSTTGAQAVKDCQLTFAPGSSSPFDPVSPSSTAQVCQSTSGCAPVTTPGKWQCYDKTATGFIPNELCCEANSCASSIDASHYACFVDGVYDSTQAACKGVEKPQTMQCDIPSGKCGSWSCFKTTMNSNGKNETNAAQCCDVFPCLSVILPSSNNHACFHPVTGFDATGAACKNVALPTSVRCDQNPKADICTGTWECGSLSTVGAWQPKSCCDLYSCRETIPGGFKMCFDKAGNYDASGLTCKDKPADSTCGIKDDCLRKFELVCVTPEAGASQLPGSVIASSSIVPCDCKADPTSLRCGQGTRHVQCAAVQYGAFVVTADSNCANMVTSINGQSFGAGKDYKCPESCPKGEWLCAHGKDDSFPLGYRFGPCDCDSFPRRSFEFNKTQTATISSSAIVGISGNATASNPCLDGVDAWNLSPICYDAFTNTVYPIGDNGTCNGETKPTEKSCKCDADVKVDWICTLSTPNGPITVPCDTGCDKLWGFANRTAVQGCEIKLQPQCVVAGTQIPATGCDANTSPAPVPCVDEKRCKYYWQCSFNGWTGPCASFSQDMCRKYRLQFPCGSPELSSQCVNALTLAPAAPSNCGAPTIPQPTASTFASTCPEVGTACNHKYGWSCGQKYANGTVAYDVRSSTIDVVINADDTTRDPFDRSKPRTCACGPTCSGYWLFSHCLDLNSNAPVADSFCDPLLQPVVNQQYCKPNALPGQCDSPCSLQCSVKVNGQPVYFPCSDYKIICARFGPLSCDSIEISTECGRLSADGVFFADEDISCCKGLELPWGTNTWAPGETYPCPAASTPQPFDLTEDAVFEELMIAPSTQDSCFVGWKCIAANGELVSCDCETLRKYHYSQVVNEDGTVSWSNGDWCASALPQPLCYKWSATNPTPLQTVNRECEDRGFVKPVIDAKCKEGCETKYQYVCYDASSASSVPVPCDVNHCQQLAISGQRCDRFKVEAKCQTSTTASAGWTNVANSECVANIGYPFSFPGFTNVCPGDRRFCESTVGKNYWECLVNGNPTLVLDSKDCDCSDTAQEIAGSCPYFITAQCSWTNGYATAVVSPQDCIDAQLGSRRNSTTCGCPETEQKQFELTCYKNGDITQPVACADKCDFGSDCDEYQIQAKCWLVVGGNQVSTVPLSNCANIPAQFDQNGVLHCQPERFSKYCSLEWQCRATNPVTGSVFTYPCAKKNFCPSSDQCTKYRVEAVCMSLQTSGLFQVNNQNCINLGLPSPVPLQQVTMCPSVLPASCYDSAKYDWRCNEGPASNTNSTDIQFECQRPTTCQSRTLFDSRRCDDWYLTAQCYQITFDAATQTTTHTLASNSNCDWSTWPITDSAGFNISSLCQNKPCKEGPWVPRRCPNNGAINPPACNIFPVDDVIAVPSGPSIDLSWSSNEGCPGNSTGVVIVRDPKLPYANVTTAVDMNSGNVIVNFNSTSTTITPSILDACGNEVGSGGVTIPSFCAVVKCAAPYVCDDAARSCACPKGKYGDNCDQTFTEHYTPICKRLGMVPDEQSPPCRCDAGFVNADGQCVEKCQALDCANGGEFDADKCGCACQSGFWGGKCEFFERFFNITFKAVPADWEVNKEMWAAMIAKYAAFDYKVDFDAVTVVWTGSTDAGFLVSFRLRICSKEQLDKWLAFYKEFQTGYNAAFANPFQMLANADDATIQSTLHNSDVSLAAGGPVAYSDVVTQSPTSPDENNARVVSTIFAVVVAAVALLM